MRGFRQAATLVNNTGRRPASSGGGGGGGWRQFKDRFRPVMSPSVDQIRLIAGAYKVTRVDPEAKDADGKPFAFETELPFFPYMEHYDGKLETSSICSAGPFAQFKDYRDPCRGHDIFFETMDRSSGRAKRGNRMSMRDMFALTVLHYAPYAKVPQRDRRTGEVRKGNDGQPYMDWQRVFPHEAANYVGYEQKIGHILHWPMGFAHYATLFEYEKTIEKSCVMCGGRQCIQSKYLVCGNPQCGDVIIENPETSSIDPSDLEKMTLQPVTCPRCQVAAMVQEIVECTSCGRGQRAGLFDVDLSISRIKTAKGDSEQTVLQILDYSNPRPISMDFQQIAQPLELDQIYAPTPWDKQLEVWPIKG